MPQLRKQVVCGLLFFWHEVAKKITAIHCKCEDHHHSSYRYKDITVVAEMSHIYGKNRRVEITEKKEQIDGKF